MPVIVIALSALPVIAALLVVLTRMESSLGSTDSTSTGPDRNR